MSGKVCLCFGTMPMASQAALSTAAASPASKTSEGMPTSRAIAKTLSFRDGIDWRATGCRGLGICDGEYLRVNYIEILSSPRPV